MDGMNQEIKQNLRSTVFTAEFRKKLELGVACIQLLRKAGVRVSRTDYSGDTPIIEIAPQHEAEFNALPGSVMFRHIGQGGHTKEASKYIHGCVVAWRVEVAA